MREESSFPRVLVISHNSFSDNKNNGKTLSALFTGWPKDCLAQFYLWPEEPDLTVCENFYRVTDYEILACFLGRSQKAGGVYLRKEKNATQEPISLDGIVGSIYKNRGNHDGGGKGLHFLIHSLFKRRVPLALIVRDILWNLNFWKTEEFAAWLNKFSPELIFFQSSNGVFAFKIVEWISRTMKIPVIMEVNDDYVSPKFTLDLFWWGHYFWLKRWFAKTVTQAYRIVAIGDLMAEEYQRRFGGKYVVLMNCVPTGCIERSQVGDIKTETVNFLFAGSLHLNRWKTISRIGDCLKELQAEGLKTKFSIYCNTEPNYKTRQAITIKDVMSYEGYLNQDELKEKLLQADVLVHVEAFDTKSKKATRLSISTKIPEYMVTGRCILAVGPKDVASIQYLEQYNMAQVCSSLNKVDLKGKLRYIIQNAEKRTEFGERAQRIAKERHDAGHAQRTIKDIVISACDNQK